MIKIFIIPGKNIAATIDDKEIILHVNATTRKTTASIDTAIGVSARKIPMVVATPLPPLNFKNKGYKCPKNADNAVKRGN